MFNEEYLNHVNAHSRFVDDLDVPEGTLYGAVCVSTIPRGRITSLDTTDAETAPGVSKVFTASDIPGENQIGTIVLDETLFAEGEVHFAGQPLALVVARSKESARKAVKLIKVEYEALPPLLDPRVAADKGELIGPSRTLSIGDVDAAWSKCVVVVADSVETGSQEHVYLETQSALALPMEGHRVKIISSTQAPTTVQTVAARVLGVSMNAVEVDVERLGGAFGGKEDQATPWAVMAALGAKILGKAVKIVLSRTEDMAYTGKRHPYSIDYKLGLDARGKALAYEVTYYQNSGAAADLSTAVLERSLYHCTSAYGIPNVRATGHCCRTNYPPFTAFRGFGAPQAVFAIESAFHRAAAELKISPHGLQEKNLLEENFELPFGMKVRECHGKRAFKEVKVFSRLKEMEKQFLEFNQNNQVQKKGFAVTPIAFGISFTSTFLNQASALVHVYRDGSVSVSTGAVEMGQGVASKIRRIAATVLGIQGERIDVESANTKRAANTSPTAASTGADLNGRATELAATKILMGLKRFAAEHFECEEEDVEIARGEVRLGESKKTISFEELVNTAYMNRVSLSAQSHYATPDIYYDKTIEKGKPFAYHVFGAAVTSVTLDCLRGTYKVDGVHIVHDVGKSLNETIDIGQIEGGLLQGIGWLTMEEMPYENGVPGALNLATYKVPDIRSAPEVTIRFMEDLKNSKAVLNSKAVGEPPFLYGMGAYFALLNAMSHFRPGKRIEHHTPLTPEKVFGFLYPKAT